MNTLYEAVMALGRSIDDLKKYGWIQDDLGDVYSSKCATGVVSCSVLGYASYPAAILKDKGSSDQLDVIGVMFKALCDVLPPEKKQGVYHKALEVDPAAAREVRSVLDGPVTLGATETMVVLTNDKLIANAEEAIQWFSDALDLLAEQLPVPARPVVPEATRAPLVTV